MRYLLPWIGVVVLHWMLALPTISRVASATITEIGYSFTKEESGGVAVARLDNTSGKIIESRVVLDSADCPRALKVRRTHDRKLVVTNADKDHPSLFVVDPAETDQVREIRLKATPDELRIAGDLGIVTCADDMIAVVDLAAARLKREWDTSKTFDPGANGPESVFITDDQQHAVVSFQKDSGQGKRKGSRIAIYRLPDVERIADIRLPRDRESLHITDNPKEQGPSPEIVYVSPATNTLIVTLDLYGAVGLMDWIPACANRRENWKAISASPSGSWGTAFPDRAAALRLYGREYYLVCNAGREGGAVLISFDSRSIVWQSGTPPGLETPVFFPSLSKAYSVCSGKTKVRKNDEVESTLHPRKLLYEFDFSSRQAIRARIVNSIQLKDEFAIRIAVARLDPPLLLIATGPAKNKPQTLISYDPVARAVIDVQPAVGFLGRFEN